MKYSRAVLASITRVLESSKSRHTVRNFTKKAWTMVFGDGGEPIMYALWARIGKFVRSEDGPAATEYAVLLALIAIGVLITMSSFGDSMNGIYLAIANAVNGVG